MAGGHSGQPRCRPLRRQRRRMIFLVDEPHCAGKDTTVAKQQTQIRAMAAVRARPRPSRGASRQLAPAGVLAKSTGEEGGISSGNAPAPDEERRARPGRLCGRSRADARSAADALKRQIRSALSDPQLCRRRAVAKPGKRAVRCVPAICDRPAGRASTGVGNGTDAVAVEATMDRSALPYCVMSLGWERQGVVSGQGSGYSSATHPEGCVWRTPSAFSPRVAESSIQ